MKRRSIAVVLTVALGLAAITGLVSNAELGSDIAPQAEATPIVTQAPVAEPTAGVTEEPIVDQTAAPTEAPIDGATTVPTEPPIDNPTPGPVEDEVEPIVFNRVTIKKGDEINLKIKGADAVKFTTSESKVAKITKRMPKLAKVQGKGIGTAIITAKTDNTESTIRVKVVKK